MSQGYEYSLVLFFHMMVWVMKDSSNYFKACLLSPNIMTREELQIWDLLDLIGVSNFDTEKLFSYSMSASKSRDAPRSIPWLSTNSLYEATECQMLTSILILSELVFQLQIHVEQEHIWTLLQVYSHVQWASLRFSSV